jgi:hypothetical protein
VNVMNEKLQQLQGFMSKKPKELVTQARFMAPKYVPPSVSLKKLVAQCILKRI